MRLTEFWARMGAAFGPSADTVARDTVLAALDHRTVHEALAAGAPAKEVWRAVVVDLQLGDQHR